MSEIEGTVDPGFNTFVLGAQETVNAIVQQPDGKILIAGEFTQYNGVNKNRIVRVDLSGNIDPTFEIGTGADSIIFAIALQPDGKILIGGTFTTYNEVGVRLITRLNTDGSLDTSFNINRTGVSSGSIVSAITVESTGKILIGGTIQAYNGSAAFGNIARLNADGTLDTTTFTGSGIGANGSVNAIVIQSDGKIMIGGNFSNYNNSSPARVRIARLNTNGSIDTSFTTGAGAAATVNTIVIQPDNKILIGGNFTNYGSASPARVRIARLETNGSIDTGFTTGTGANNTIRSIALQSDGKILIGGQFTAYNSVTANRIAQLNSDGTLNTGFTTSFSSFTPGLIFVLDLKILQDNTVLVGGRFTNYATSASSTTLINRANIARINLDGSLDSLSFIGRVPANNQLNAVTVNSSNKVIIGGSHTAFNEISKYRYLTSINTDGTLDLSFNELGLTGIAGTGPIRSVVYDPSGRLMIGGTFTSYNNTNRTNIARINSDGLLDVTFDPGSGIGGIGTTSVYTIVIQPDGKILVGGDFTTYNGASNMNRIIRIDESGSLDPSFDIGTGTTAGATGPAGTRVAGIALQEDGKILIVGNFTNYNNSSPACVRIARLNTDGTVDSEFNTGSGTDNIINTVAIDATGNILIGGVFSTYNGEFVNRIARLSSNGILDTSFNSGISNGPNGPVNAITIQPDGKILLGGLFTTYNGEQVNRIVRLNTDGTIDSTFNPGSIGANDVINALALTSDGKLMIAGNFKAYNNEGYTYTARLFGYPVILTHSVLLVGPSTYIIKGDVSVYSTSAITSLKNKTAIDPDTKYVSWLTDGIASNGTLLRSLERRVYIYTTGRRPLVRYIFTNIQCITKSLPSLSTTREPYLTGWICTWSADNIYPEL